MTSAVSAATQEYLSWYLWFSRASPLSPAAPPASAWTSHQTADKSGVLHSLAGPHCALPSLSIMHNPDSSCDVYRFLQLSHFLFLKFFPCDVVHGEKLCMVSGWVGRWVAHSCWVGASVRAQADKNNNWRNIRHGYTICSITAVTPRTACCLALFGNNFITPSNNELDSSRNLIAGGECNIWAFNVQFLVKFGVCLQTCQRRLRDIFRRLFCPFCKHVRPIRTTCSDSSHGQRVTQDTSNVGIRPYLFEERLVIRPHRQNHCGTKWKGLTSTLAKQRFASPLRRAMNSVSKTYWVCVVVHVYLCTCMCLDVRQYVYVSAHLCFSGCELKVHPAVAKEMLRVF